METIRHHIEKLLRRAAANPTRVPHLVRALTALEVIFLWDYVTGPAQMPHTQICACKHQGRLVLPCFSSRQQLREAGLEPGLLRSASSKGKVGSGVPLSALRFYFPRLWPEAEAAADRST